MPDDPNTKMHEHPHASVEAWLPTPKRKASIRYAELECTSNFTFLTGASHPDELAREAAALGIEAVAITDTHTVAGVVRAHVAAKQAGIRCVVGTRIMPEDAGGLAVLLYPFERAGYAGLCRMLTIGKRRTEKGKCRLLLGEVLEHHAGLVAVAVPSCLDDSCMDRVRSLRVAFTPDRLSVAASFRYGQDDARRVASLAAFASDAGVPLVATNAVQYHTPARRMLHDVLACVRHGVTIEQAGHKLCSNAERHLKQPEEIARLFRSYPAAIARTVEIAERCAGFSLDELRYEYPDEVVPPGQTPMGHLVALTRAGALRRFPGGVPASVSAQIEHELRLIEELRYAPYFLTVHDIVAFAESRAILCQGRGAAANSAVCYCLGVTAVDPTRVNMLFERFISKERDEPPDIDIDFEHARREEVIQHLYRKYGRDRAALTAEVISYRGRSAIRDVGKALGLSSDMLGIMAKDIEWWNDTPDDSGRLRGLGLNPKDPHIARVVSLARELCGFPRHLSQHVGGFVITRTPLCELVPVENAAMPDRTVIEWDKDDIEVMGMLKVDVLGLGMLSCVRKTLDLIERHDGERLTLATIPPEDPATYDMACDADTLGVFQIESRAQMSMLPRLRPRCYYDLVIEVAIVRPGPIQGKMVHPYIRRRNGEESIVYPSPDIERVLSRTLGVPLFQEQAMALAVVAAGFTPGEADQLRRAMAAWKRSGDAIFRFERKLKAGMLERGHTPQFADQVYQQISGFSGYGFPESHAASFALLVYSSAWLKRHKPAAFAAALINSQPMGFYQPAQIVQDAKNHAVAVRPVDVNKSDWDCTLEPGEHGHALRLGMRLVKGLPYRDAERIVEARRKFGSFTDVRKLWRQSGATSKAMRVLAEADAFGSLGLSRRESLWAVQSLNDDPMPLFESVTIHEEPARLPLSPADAEVTDDYQSVGLSLKAHPLSFAREYLANNGVRCCGDLIAPQLAPDKSRVTVAGLVLVRQRPGTASGIVFFTIEDETGIANLVVWPKVYERFRRIARHKPVLAATGRIDRVGKVVHVVVDSFRAINLGAGDPLTHSRNFH
jgi:error-prone DNA polymerase